MCGVLMFWLAYVCFFLEGSSFLSNQNNIFFFRLPGNSLTNINKLFRHTIRSSDNVK